MNRHPYFNITQACLWVEGFTVEFEFRSACGLVFRFLKPSVEDGEPSAANRGNVIAMKEHGIPLFRDFQTSPVIGAFGSRKPARRKYNLCSLRRLHCKVLQMLLCQLDQECGPSVEKTPAIVPEWRRMFRCYRVCPDLQLTSLFRFRCAARQVELVKFNSF